ncbi:MAG: SHOCT domain-containing protein [Acholeplasma sp.]
MKKTYNLGLLTGGIILMLALIASFVLQDYFTPSFLTLSFTFDTFVLIAVAFILILQFKSYAKIAAIILVVYGAFNILYGIVGSYELSSLLGSMEIEVIFILGLLLAHVIFEISVLFVLLHVTQPRFDIKFTKKFVMIALIVSLVLLVAISPLVTPANFQSIVRMIFSILSIGALYLCVYLMVTEKVDEPEPLLDNIKIKQQELTRLYERGIITQEEYEIRLEKNNKS